MRTLLFLHWRNFGDAVIGLGLIEAMRLSQPHVHIDILTRPQFAFLYQNHPSVRHVYTASFPIGTMRNFSLRDAVHLAAELLRARRRRYDAVANLFSDVRENLAGYLIAPHGNFSPIWPITHPVSIQSRIGPSWLLSHPVLLPQDIQSVYDGMGYLNRALGADAPAIPRVYGTSKSPVLHTPKPGRVGLHVSAGQECRRWPMDRWVDLAKQLLAEGYDLRIYCATNERDSVETDFQQLLTHKNAIAVVAGSIENFLNDTATCTLFLGHDSFGIHAAAALGVPRIMINGANVADVWAPPETVILRGNESLVCFPCFNKPTCSPGPSQYACVRAISVDAAHNLIQISR
jgi:ADP-heptose:LPS heptosyltransferase